MTERKTAFVLISGFAVLLFTIFLMVACGTHNAQEDAKSTTPGDPSTVGRWDSQPGDSAPLNTWKHERAGTTNMAPSPLAREAGEADPDVTRDAMPTGSLPSPDEEVWVIIKPKPQAQPRAAESDDTPGSGAMVTEIQRDGEPQRVPVPLKHTDVRAQVDGYIASVDVTQQFHNPYDQKIEAVYVFPLPQNAAVNSFVMQIGERKIRGIIREREEAQRIYDAAKSAGHVASLLTQERPNIFTQKVANIEPNKQVDVHIRYFHTLRYNDGYYELTFPMVVGPRFNPPSITDGVGAVSRGAHGASGQKTEVQYLRPNERSGHDIALTVALNAGVTIESVHSVNHRIDIDEGDGRNQRVTLAKNESLPNKDFVLRWRVAGDQLKATMITHRGEPNEDGYFSLMLYPPAELDKLERHPLELIFVLDCSGSMRGEPIAQAKAAIDHALTQLRPTDTFQVIRFSNNASQFGDKPVLASRDNVDRAREYVRTLHGSGGTMMIEGIRAALHFPHDPQRLRFVVFLTDGYIGNEAQILGEMKRLLGDSRVFSFGVGSSPNRYLMHRMAKLGNGAVAFLPLGAYGDEVMDAFFSRVAHPAMANLAIDFGDMQVTDLQPDRVPDLFVGRPVILTGRFKPTDATGPTTLRITGDAGGQAIEVGMRVDLSDAEAAHPALPAVWARQRIAELMDEATYQDTANLAGRVKEIALEHSLMSAYTAFVAVDASRITEGEVGTTVPVPVPVPDGVQYETTVTP